MDSYSTGDSSRIISRVSKLIAVVVQFNQSMSLTELKGGRHWLLLLFSPLSIYLGNCRLTVMVVPGTKTNSDDIDHVKNHQDISLPAEDPTIGDDDDDQEDCNITMKEAAPISSPIAKEPVPDLIATKVESTSGAPFPKPKKATRHF
ncbi:hypothetical protein BY996DRAFT_6415830 [Phakopsora pachyrhizi]|nr:hypothetical protein BY996DRAFT_6415830 [Phakopsora pachyrhizi]